MIKKEDNIFNTSPYGRDARNGEALDLLGAIQASTNRHSVDVTNASSAAMAAAVSADPNAKHPFMEDQQKEPDAIFPTDLINQKIDMPTLKPVDKINVNQVVNQAPPDPEKQIEKQEAAVDTYMEMDKEIKSEFMEALNEVDPEAAKIVGSAIPSVPGGTSPLIQAASSMAGQAVAPTASNVWTAIDAIYGDANNNVKSEAVKSAVAKTLENLQAKTDAQNELASQGKGPPPRIDWNKVETPKQMMEFLTRDVTKDPFMQKAADNDRVLEVMVDNKEKYDEVYVEGKQKINAEMITQAVQSGNDSQLKALVKGDENKVLQAKMGDSQGVLQNNGPTAAEIKMNSDLSYMSGVKADKLAISDVNSGAKDVVAKLILPPPEHAMKPQNNADFSMKQTA
ncbi:MAG: hypothetical protein WBK77_03465 [Alphaproteobacteria bacterium]